MGTVIIVLLAIILIPFLVIGLKASWNDPGGSRPWEKF